MQCTSTFSCVYIGKQCWASLAMVALKLVKVHENKHLVEQCIALLNEEWPRDKAARLRTLNKSSDHYPMCLALVDTDNQSVLGFVKLTSELPFNASIFLESLVVDK